MPAQPTRIDALPGKVGQEVLLEGWLYARRSSGKLEFLQVRDGSGVVQCVASKADLPEEVFARAAAVSSCISFHLFISSRLAAPPPPRDEMR